MNKIPSTFNSDTAPIILLATSSTAAPNVGYMRPVSARRVAKDKVTKLFFFSSPVVAGENVRDEIKEKFDLLAKEWRAETIILSATHQKAMHPAYQKIIGLGQDVVPYMLRELSEHGGHWFWALNAITGEDPVKKRDLGNIKRETDTWIKWGRKKGLIL